MERLVPDTLLDNIPAIVYVADADDRIVYISPQVERVTGVPPSTWHQAPGAWARQIHPDDRERALREMTESRRRGTPFRCEYRMRRADGSVVWLLDEASQVRDADGRVLATHGVALDVTERKAAEADAAARAAELHVLHRVSDIALADRPLDEAYREILETICDVTGFGMAAVSLYDARTDTVTYRCTRNLPAALHGLTFTMGDAETFSAAVLKTGRPFLWTSEQPLPAHLHATLRALEIATFASVPMLVAGRVIGALGLADRAARPIEPVLVQLLSSVANHLAGLIERSRTQDALRASERQFRAVFDSAGDAMLLIDESRTYVAVNASAAQLFGRPAGEMLGRRFGDSTAPGTDVEGAWAAVTAGRLRVDEWSLVRADGALRNVESTITPNVLPGCHLFAIRDLTDRQREEADARVRATALAAAANGIMITDADGRIEWVNPEFTRMTGYTLDEVRGGTPRRLKSGLHPPAFYEALWDTIRAGRVWRGELVNRCKDGTVYHEEMSITPVLSQGPDPHIEHFVAVKQDVTERKRSEEAVRASEEYHRALIESALDIIVVMGADSTVRYASPSVQAVLGYRPEDLVGMNALAQIHPDDLPRVAEIFFGGLRQPDVTAAARYRFRHADGSWRTLEGVGRNLLQHKAVAGIVVNARDATERERQEATEARLQQQLAHSEKLAAMSELLAGVAHELNNPLSVVIGHTTLLARAGDSSVAGRAAKIGKAAERCGRIVKNFLALARQYPPERSAVGLNDVVRDALEVMAYALRVDDIHVVTELDDSMPSLSGDPHQLQQVVVNLVTNAHQAMRSARGAVRRLTLRSGWDASGGQAWLEVADSGPGIPPDVEARLFEPFFTTKPVGQGTGLGLSICQGIVTNHGGRLTVDAGFGHGATFRIALPVSAGTTVVATPDDEGPMVPPRRVLVVDDEPEIAAVVSELLRRDGHHVTVASDGGEAIASLSVAVFDAVLSDIKMPHVDGPALWQAVRETTPALADRFVFLTGDTLNPSTAEFLDRTGAPSLKKPFALRDVRAALARVPPPAPPADIAPAAGMIEACPGAAR